MSQEKAQLIAPLGNVTFSGVTATGVITATSLSGNITGSASSIVQGTSITAGVVTASSFAGNLTGNIQRLADSGPNISVGVVTATSFSGNLTGSVTDLTGTPAISVGVVTATTLKGPVTGDITGNITGNVSGVATGNVTGNVDGDITGNVTGTIAGNVTGNVTGNASGYAGGLGVNYNGGWTGAGTSQISVGVITATVFHGDGQYLDGVSSGPVSQQAVTINGASTAIDLSEGNIIYATQSADTTVSFANSENGNVYFIRIKDDTSTARTITWPDTIKWEGGSAPTLLSNPRATDAQIFNLITRDEGVTWYGVEVVNVDPQTFGFWAWGGNLFGTLGLNQAPGILGGTSSPIQVGTDLNWGKYNSNNEGTCSSTKTDGTLWAWGGNSHGQMGNNENNNQYSSPVQVGTDTTWSNVNTIGGGSGAIKTDATLWVWGTNGYGELGLNQPTNAHLSSPAQVPGSWSMYSRGPVGSFGVKTDGTLWSWGNNTIGELGLNNKTSYSSPKQIGTDTDWAYFNTGNVRGGFAIKTDGTLWSWGSNSGALGHNNRTGYSSPRQVGTNTTWSEISGGGQTVVGTKTDGTMWVWGPQQQGSLGLNDQVDRSSPVQMGTGTDWRKGMIGYYSGYATKTDGTLWAWGQNSGYTLTTQTTQYSSPIQIPGTDWNLDNAQTLSYTVHMLRKQ
jgi:alpha-tubulin suppressor-like RCC1 family protein